MPFQLIWTDASNNTLTQATFPISFPGVITPPQQLQVHSNAAALQTFETLIDVKFYLTGTAADVNTVQNVWTTLGPANQPQLNGGYDISFDYGQTYSRFNATTGVQSKPLTWIPLPAKAVGIQGANQTLGAFDIAHLMIRMVIPPGITQFQKMDVRLGMDFDII